MRIAVTGATGFIGRHVMRALLDQGFDDILQVGRTRSVRDKRITFVNTDLLADNGQAWLARYRPTHVVHLAWYAEHGRFWDSPLNRDWRDATVRLASAFCEQGGKQILMTGSCAEYDWSAEGYCKEGVTPLNPSTLYGQEKHATCELIEEVCRTYDVSYTWGRVFFPFGPGENSRRLIPSVVDALLGRREDFSINTGHWRDLMPAHSVADALIYLLRHEVSGVLNICSGVPVQLNDVIELLGRALGKDTRALTTLSINNGKGPRFLAGDNSALLNTGWQPNYDLGESLRRYAQHLERTVVENEG